MPPRPSRRARTRHRALVRAQRRCTACVSRVAPGPERIVAAVTAGPRVVDTGWTAFELERWQSDFEQQVEINLADSGVAPVTVAELLDGQLGQLSGHPLHYPEVNGTHTL